MVTSLMCSHDRAPMRNIYGSGRICSHAANVCTRVTRTHCAGNYSKSCSIGTGLIQPEWTSPCLKLKTGGVSPVVWEHRKQRMEGRDPPTHALAHPTSTVFFCCIIEAPYMAVRSRLCVVMSPWVLEMGFPCVATHEWTHPFSVSNFQ